MNKSIKIIFSLFAVVSLSSFKNSNGLDVDSNLVKNEKTATSPLTDSVKTLVIAPAEITNAMKKEKKKKIALVGNFGYSYRINEVDPSLSGILKQHVEKLKSGYSYDITAYYMYLKTMGFGLKYNVHNASQTTSNLVFTDSDGRSTYGGISDKISVDYFALAYIAKTPRSKTGEAFFEMSLGYMHYSNDYIFISEQGKYTGGNLGLSFGFGYDFQIAPNFLIGPKINFATTTLSSVQAENKLTGTKENLTLKDNKKIGLTRIDFSVGATVSF